MKNLKILVALLLSLVMVLSLVACGDSGSRRDDDDDEKEEKTEAVAEDEDEDEDEDKKKDDNKKDEEDIDVGDYADLIVGDWEAEINVGGIFEAMVSEVTDGDLDDYIDLDDVCGTFEISFDDDGEEEFRIDFNDAMDDFKEVFIDAFEEYADDEGEDADEIYDAYGGKDEFVEELFGEMGIEDFSETDSGDYEIDGGVIYIEGDEYGIEFTDEDCFVLDISGSELADLFDMDELEFERQ